MFVAAEQVHVDEEGNPTKTPGKVSSAFILKHCPIEIGTLYSMKDGHKTLQNVFALDLFDNVQVGVGGWVWWLGVVGWARGGGPPRVQVGQRRVRQCQRIRGQWHQQVQECQDRGAIGISRSRSARTG